VTTVTAPRKVYAETGIFRQQFIAAMRERERERERKKEDYD
jgi:hypothetical protein